MTDLIRGPALKPSDIAENVRGVLLAANPGEGTDPTYLSAYQILDRLPTDIRDRLIEERTVGGAGTGRYYTAASVVSQAAKMVGANDIYIDNAGLLIEVAGEPIRSGNPVCAFYRLTVNR